MDREQLNFFLIVCLSWFSFTHVQPLFFFDSQFEVAVALNSLNYDNQKKGKMLIEIYYFIN